MVTVADNSETMKAIVHHTTERLSAGKRKNALVTDLYSLFSAAIETNSQDTNAHTMHSANTCNQDWITAPMSIPAITSRKEINVALFCRDNPPYAGERAEQHRPSSILPQ